MNTNHSLLNDQKLYHLCKFYGEQAKKWRYKFMGLLPEVYKRKLYQKKGFSSVFEFAKKLAGLSEEQVRRVLNLEKKFEETPLLKNHSFEWRGERKQTGTSCFDCYQRK